MKPAFRIALGLVVASLVFFLFVVALMMCGMNDPNNRPSYCKVYLPMLTVPLRLTPIDDPVPVMVLLSLFVAYQIVKPRP